MELHGWVINFHQSGQCYNFVHVQQSSEEAFISNDLPMSYFQNMLVCEKFKSMYLPCCTLLATLLQFLSHMAFTSSCYNNSKLIIVLCYIFLQILNSNFIKYAVTHMYDEMRR